MTKYVIKGGKSLRGTTKVSGAKNVALKAIVAACLTDEEVVIHNVPHISDFKIMTDIIKNLGGTVHISDHTAKVRMENFRRNNISLDTAAHIRTSSMFLSPLLAREKEGTVPNPGGCRIGARPIDRTIEALRKMGASVEYSSDDGYFYGKVKTPSGRLEGATIHFDKNTHTGTETILIAASLANGTTRIENAAEEPEVDELIEFLNKMGAKIKRVEKRVIEIEGVDKLHGAEHTISPDRNEVVTLAIASVVTKGDIFIEDAQTVDIDDFLEPFIKAGGGVEKKESGIRFYYKQELVPVDVTTAPYPGFMTDWQAPWAVLMTQANGTSVIHETIYESRFSYVPELRKMGAKIILFRPVVENPEKIYNFNVADDLPENMHAAKITGPQKLHNAIVAMTDLRAGATLVIAALAAKGETTIHGISHIQRGYENFEVRLQRLGAEIQKVEE
jgi:UDP-N-acetylglucosamine 1-carboxyvinyltransferase